MQPPDSVHFELECKIPSVSEFFLVYYLFIIRIIFAAAYKINNFNLILLDAKDIQASWKNV